jgi:hypothetical protein
LCSVAAIGCCTSLILSTDTRNYRGNTLFSRYDTSLLTLANC